MINLLYIDAEPGHGISFKANYRRSYHVTIASTISEALEILQDKPVHLVFADHRQLVQQPLFTSPHQILPILIIVYAGISLQELHKLPDWKHAFQIISKPWQEKEVEEVIQLGAEEYALREKLLKQGVSPADILKTTSKASIDRVKLLLNKANKRNK